MAITWNAARPTWQNTRHPTSDSWNKIAFYDQRLILMKGFHYFKSPYRFSITLILLIIGIYHWKYPNIEFNFDVFDLRVLIGQNLMSKSKWWVLIIVYEWVPNVKFDCDVCVDCRQCLTDISKSNLMLGTFSDMCP